MKKIMMVFVLIVCGVSAYADQMTVANNDPVYDWTGAVIPNAGFTEYIRIYESLDANINFSIVNGAISLGDDFWTGYTTLWNPGSEDPGYLAIIVDPSDTTYGLTTGNRFYSVLFSSDSTISGYCAVMDSAAATVGYTGGNMDYDPTGVTGGLKANGGDWMAIPEPATMGLMALGGGLAWLIRLKQRIA